MVAYVILHYRAIDSTINCINSIKALEGDNHIVVVDNASPDGTGLRLWKKYRDDKQVSVLLSSENAGFARGNNLGVMYTCRALQADFVVVLNDDVLVPQKDFSTQIYNIYRQHPFDLLGPDIVSVFSGIHQSPKSLRGHSLESVRKKAAYVKRSQNPILMLLSSGQKNNPTIWKMFQRRYRAKQNIDSSKAMEGVVLHGSCVIFSARYLKKHPEPFYPKTFMYFEMEILEWLCRQENAVIRYDPSISVLHYQYVATHMEYKTMLRRCRFVASCLYDSLMAAQELMSGMEQLPEPEAEESQEGMLIHFWPSSAKESEVHA